MSPTELKILGVRHLQAVLDRTTDPAERTRIEGLIVEERAKPESAYPVWKEARDAGGPDSRGHGLK